MISLDTETTGLDFRHGARPYLVTMTEDNGDTKFWEWDVDPLTREVVPPEEDLEEIRRELEIVRNWGHPRYAEDVRDRHVLVLQNAKFDVTALASIGVVDFPWSCARDTLVAGHLLASNRPKDLTSLAAVYLGVDIQPYEDRLEQVVQECRRLCRRKDFVAEFGEWAIAKAGREDMPSAKDGVWKIDGWLPRAVAKVQGLPPDDPKWTVLSEYANADSVVTVKLWPVMLDEIRRRGLKGWYDFRTKVPPILYRMEGRGVTADEGAVDRVEEEYTDRSEKAGNVLVNLAAGYGYELELPKNGVNASLRTFCFDYLKLEPVRNPKNKTDAPSLDKNAMAHYQATLDVRSKESLFVNTLLTKRSLDTGLSFLTSYRKFWIRHPELVGYRTLHPNFNFVGPATTRMSCENPNAQQISKKEDYNLRYCFGPTPGREWWSLDAKNIELRIPAYESGEEELIALFERPDEPPYYGSEHLLNFSTIYPDIWERELREVGIEKVGPHCKKKYASTWYQWCKNFDFAVGYQAGDTTADRAAHRPGSRRRVIERFEKKTALNEKWVRFAEKHGYVETMIDPTIDPKRGYPLLVSRSEWGRVSPTEPLNYRVQGTAGVWMNKAMIRCQEQLDEWREADGFDGYIAITVHDELVFDLPKAGHPVTDPENSNLGRVRVLQSLMARGGEDVGVPTPVGVEYNETTWAEGVTL